MASFLKKLVEHRSKSPQKKFPNGGNNNFPRPNQLPPVCYLPLPPSPLSIRGPSPNGSTRASSGHSNHRLGSNQSSNQSNESYGILTWNTEPRNSDDTVFMADGVGTFSSSMDHNRSPYDGPGPLMRARSHSPRKAKFAPDTNGVKVKSKSKSPQKKHRTIINQLDYLNSQCHMEGCSASVIVHSTRFLICRHQLCHASDYFKDLFRDRQTNEDIHISVSSLSEPSPSTQFRWFIESSIPNPALKDISDETLETCMRLSRRFYAKGLQLRCSKFLVENACSRQPIVALCWLNWALKHKFDAQTQASLLPAVARLSLCSLEKHRNMMTDQIFANVLAAKLRGTYDKAVQVFRSIHAMDHFQVEVEKCPRCHRTREGMRVRVNCDPCRKQIGCDRCHQEGCEIEEKAGEDLQAYFQCPHQLVPLNDSTDDCQCQISSLARHLGAQVYYRPQENEYINGYPSPKQTTRRTMDKRRNK